MSDDTLIADLIAAGLSAELVARVAKLSGELVAYETMSRTMSGTMQHTVQNYERTRKREWRDKKLNSQAKSKANDVDQLAPEVSAIPPKCPGHVPDKNEKLLSLSIKERDLINEVKVEEKKEVLRAVVVDRGKGGRSARGTRLPQDWQPSEVDRDFAHQQGFSDQRINAAAAEFHDYWIGVPGQRGCKADWAATWRNRIRQTKGSSSNGYNGRRRDQRTTTEIADDLIARAEGTARQAGAFGSDDYEGPIIEGSKLAD